LPACGTPDHHPQVCVQVSRRRARAPARVEAGDSRPCAKHRQTVGAANGAGGRIRAGRTGAARGAASGKGSGNAGRTGQAGAAAIADPKAGTPEAAADAPPAAAVTPSPQTPPRKPCPPPASVAPAEAAEHPSACLFTTGSSSNRPTAAVRAIPNTATTVNGDAIFHAGGRTRVGVGKSPPSPRADAPSTEEDENFHASGRARMSIGPPSPSPRADAPSTDADENSS